MDTIKGECDAAGRSRRAGADQAAGITAKLAGTLRRAGDSRSASRIGNPEKPDTGSGTPRWDISVPWSSKGRRNSISGCPPNQQQPTSQSPESSRLGKPRNERTRRPLVLSILFSSAHEGLSFRPGNARDFQERPPHPYRPDPGQEPSG